MKIKTKIDLAILIPIIIIVISGVTLAYYSSTSRSRNHINSHLASVAKNKANWINSYFLERKGDTSS